MIQLRDNCFFVDNSSIELITTCPWKAYAKILRKRTVDSETPALRFGTHIHAALAFRYRCEAIGKDFDPNIQSRVIARRFERTPCESEDWRNVSTAQAVLNEYNIKYIAEPFDILRLNGFPIVEKPFCLYAGDVDGTKIFYIGRIDLAYRDGQHLYVLDHKTSSMLGLSYWQDVAMSEQQRGYCWALREVLGEEPLGYVINVLACRKPSKTGKAIEFARNTTFTREPAGQLDEWRENMLNQVSEFLWHVKRNIFPRHHKHCVHKYGTCEFYSCCELPPQSRETALMGSPFKESDWSPLYK